MYKIGVDIGGMSIKIGLVDNLGKIVAKSVVETNKDFNISVKEFCLSIKNILENNKLSLNDISGIGVGLPGAVNSKTGIVDFLPNLGWKNIDLVSLIKNYFDTKVCIANDANAAILGECKYGVAKNYDSAVMFTLGTGVGGGVVIGGKLFEGEECRGTELGHVTLVLDGIECTCGRKGCVERYVSATALIEQTKNAMIEDKSTSMWTYVNGDINNVTGRTAFECAKKDDELAKQVVENYVKYLSESIMNMLNVFRPKAFIIGGGISAEGAYLIDKVINYCEKKEYGYKGAPKTQILKASLGNDAGIIGAAALID